MFICGATAKRGDDVISGGKSMSANRTAAALEATRATIERHLLAAFSQLDAGTSDVEIRKQLYARMIGQAIQIARERFPDNAALVETIEKIVASLRPSPAEPLLLRHR